MAITNPPTPVRMRFAISLLLLLISATATTRPTPPSQPETGPGGSDYSHADLIMHRYGEGDDQYWILEPAAPRPASAPVIIFNHGWSAMTPNTYGKWIRHLVRRGNIVIYPRYQASIFTLMTEFTPNAISEIRAAMVELKTGDHVRPELDHVAFIGHSMGGAITANLAALASADGLPIPSALCCVEPANHGQDYPKISMPMADLSKISPDTLSLVIVGDQDRMAGDDTAKMIFADLTQIPPEKKNYVTLVSDEHGEPPLIASHMVPVAFQTIDANAEENKGLLRDLIRQRMEQKPPDALAYYGLWKLFDGLTDAAFYGKNIKYALGNTPEQRYMGKWSDGAPVKELKISDQP